MSLLHPRSRGFAVQAATAFPHDPTDERAWSGGQMYQTSSGLLVTRETAFQVSCIFHGARLYGETLGSLPIRLLRDLGDNRKEEVTNDPRRRLLKTQPNVWQTAQQFRETMTAWALLYPNAIAEIKSGPRGAFDQLWPIEPSWVETEQIKSTKKLRFIIDEPGEPRRVLLQDEVFRVEGFGLHRFLPESVLKLAREAIGLWLSHQKFQGLYFGQGAKPSVWLQVPAIGNGQPMAPEAYLRLKNTLGPRYEGWHSHHKVAIVEQGTTVKETGYNARDSQMTEAKRELVEDLARWLNLPPQFFMLVAEPTHSSAEVFWQQAITISFQPWATRWEQCAKRDLFFEEEDDLYFKHIFDSHLRGRTLERAQAYAQFIMNGVMSENECRIREDLDPWPGLDEPRRSANQDRGADPNAGEESGPPPARKRKQKPTDDEEAATAPTRLLLMAENDAARVVRRELSVLRDKGAKLAADPKAWTAWLTEFYGEHERMVSEALQLPPLLGRRYAEGHRAALEAGGLAAAERWEVEAVKELTALAVVA